MNSLAPFCSEVRSSRSVPDCIRWPPSAADTLVDSATKDTSRPAAKVANFFTMRIFWTGRWMARAVISVMHRHPLRYRLCFIELGPERHGDEEGEVQERQDPAGTRTT